MIVAQDVCDLWVFFFWYAISISINCVNFNWLKHVGLNRNENKKDDGYWHWALAQMGISSPIRMEWKVRFVSSRPIVCMCKVPFKEKRNKIRDSYLVEALNKESC